MSLSPQASPTPGYHSRLSGLDGEEGGGRDSSSMCGELMGEADRSACSPGTILKVLAISLRVPVKKSSSDSDRPRGGPLWWQGCPVRRRHV